MPSAFRQLDSTVEVVTPENIAFHYQVAGPFRRLPAFLLDLLIRGGFFALVLVVIGCAGALANLGGLLIGGFLVFWFLLSWFYGGILETWLNGQTPGKWLMGIRVLSVDGQPINAVQAILRNILRAADMLPGTSMLGLVTMTLTDRFQRLGDLASGTMVVIEERKWLTGVATLEDPRVAQLASYLPADYRVSRSLARTLAAYVDRRRFFSAPRRREVARHLAEPLLREFGFPLDTSYDLLLCALYHRTFIADRGTDVRPANAFGASPFSPAGGVSPAAASPLGPSLSP